MKYNRLGKTDLEVSELCLGTMTFGEQNTESEAHQQLNLAFDAGINFIDTAELYAVPSKPETQGFSENILGTWIARNPDKRKDIIIGTKAVGPSPNLLYIADDLGFSEARLEDAITKSLLRLETDYIDLYQLHWPERKTNRFGIRNYVHDDKWQDNFSAILEKLDNLKQRGLIRYYGISNETPWGSMNYFKLADSMNIERPVSIQNAFSLLNRTFEMGMSEVAQRENLGLLAYSPLGMGMLTGKYHDDSDKETYRLSRFGDRLPRYNGENTFKAAREYIKIAEKYKMKPSQFALQFVLSRPFVKSAIFGATSLDQLEENIASLDVKWTQEMEADIDRVQDQFPNPST